MKYREYPKYKIGDRVQCIDRGNGYNLTEGKFYLILNKSFDKSYNEYVYWIICDDGLKRFFVSGTNSFMSMKELRKRKLKKLNNES